MRANGIGTLTACAATCLISTLALNIVSRSAAAEESKPIFPTVCLDREVSLLTIIDDHAMVEDVSADKLSAAFSGLLDARALCYGGKTSEAVSAYLAIEQGLGKLHIGRRD